MYQVLESTFYFILWSNSIKFQNNPIISQVLESSETLNLVNELVVNEDKEKDNEHKRKIDELTATIKDLQKQLKSSHENQKELKLLLDVFKGSVKESRSKVPKDVSHGFIVLSAITNQRKIC